MKALFQWQKQVPVWAGLLVLSLMAPPAALANSCNDLIGSVNPSCQTAACLIEVLLDEGQAPEIRTTALQWLCSFEEAEVVEAILRAANNANQDVRFASLGDLARRRVAAAEEVLIEALTDPERAVRSIAVSGLAGIGSDRAVAAIAEAYFTFEPGLRAVTLDAVAARGSSRLEELLALAKLDESADVRLTAAIIESDRGSSAHLGDLVTALSIETFTEPEVSIARQRTSEKQLQRIVAALETHSRESFGYVKPYNAPVSRAEKAEALARVAAWAKEAGVTPDEETEGEGR